MSQFVQLNPFAELISIIVNFYVSIVLLRFFLQYFRADFHNPLSQFVVKATTPLVKPMRKIIPGFAGLDISSLILAWLILLFIEPLLLIVSGYKFELQIGYLLVDPIFKVISACFQLFMFLVIIRAISSWVATGGYNPVFALIGQLTEPLISKCRRILPAMGGFDLSPMIAILGLWFINRLLEVYLFPVILKLVS
jgi:YggT family protein